MATNYNSFAEGLDVVLAKEGEAWSNITDSLGENALNDIWGSVETSKESFATEHVGYNFKNTEISEFIEQYPTTAVLKFTVKYSFHSSKGAGASISLQPYLAVEGVDIGSNSQIIDGVAVDDTEGAIKTAIVSFYFDNIPTEELILEKFQFVMAFDGNNPQSDTVEIRVYSIGIQIVNATGVGYLLATTTNGFVMEDKGSASLPTIINGVSGGDKAYLYNVGDQKVTIEQGDIITEKGYIKFQSEPYPEATTEIEKGNYIEVLFDYFSEELGSYEDTINVNSTASINPFAFSYQFTVSSTGQDLFSTISPSYQSNQISDGTSFSLSSFPIGVTTVITIRVNNIGTSSLLISSIAVSGDGNLSSGSIGPGTSIPPSYYGNLNINLSTNIEGNKSVSVQIVSNSKTNSVYNFTLTYAILQQSKIEFSEGFSSGSSDSVLIDGQETDFGTVERDRSLSRYFVLKNSGIYKNLIINSISSSSSNMPVSGLPSLPYTLIPNNGNAITFSVGFETSEVGLKEGVLSIDYVEGSVYIPPISSPPPPPPSAPVNPGNSTPIGPGGEV